MFIKPCIFFLILNLIIYDANADDLRILHLGEKGDSVANEFIEKAVNYANEKDPARPIYLTSFYFESNENITTVCDRIAEYNNQSLEQHLILDMTKKPDHRNTATKIFFNYRLPVISIDSTLDEIPNPIEDSMEYFLMRFSPPNLHLHLVIREIAYEKGMTDLAIVYTKEYSACKSLREEFITLGILCVFIKYHPDKRNSILDAINGMYFKNVFLLGEISLEREKFLTGKVVFSVDSKYHSSTNYDVHIFPRIANRDLLNEISGGTTGDALELAFYFEVTLMGIHALRKMVAKSSNAMTNSCASSGESSPPDFRKHFTPLEKPIFQKISFERNNDSRMELELAYWSKQFDAQLGAFSEKGQIISNPEIWQAIKSKNHYRVLARIKPPFIYQDPLTGVYSGYSIDLLNRIASILGFTYDLEVLPNKPFSDYYDDTSQGFIKTMVKRQFDIGLGPVYESVRHSSEVQYSIPYYRPVGIKFVMKRSKDDSIFTFITVLETIVWVCILSAFFMNSFMLWLAERFSPYSYRNNKEKYIDDDEVRDFTVKECLWFCLTSLTPQGGGIVPKHLSGRLVVITWWLFGFIILASYTANLAAFLTLSKLKNPIESFNDLYRQFRMHYAPLEGTDEMVYFKTIYDAERQTRNELKVPEYPLPNRYNRMNMIIKNTTYPRSIEVALEWVFESKTATEGFAFFVDSVDARYLLMTRCNLIDIEEEVAKRHLVIAVPAYTLLKHDIDKALTQILQTRFDVELEKKWWDENPHRATNCVELEDESDGIGIYNIGGVFFIIFIGIGISQIATGYDYFMYLRRQRGRVTAVTPVPVENDDEDARVTESAIPEQKREEEERENASSKLQHRNVARY